MLDETIEEELIEEEEEAVVKEAVEVSVIEGSCNPADSAVVCLLSVSDLVKED